MPSSERSAGVGLAQSPHFRDGIGRFAPGTQWKDGMFKGAPRDIAKAIQSPDGGAGAFVLSNHALRHDPARDRFTGHAAGSRGQIHGLGIVTPSEDGGRRVNFLAKAQVIPNIKDKTAPAPDSWFLKALGSARFDPNGQATGISGRLDIGRGDEDPRADKPNDRGRTAVSLFFGHRASSGEVTLGAGAPIGARPDAIFRVEDGQQRPVPRNQMGAFGIVNPNHGLSGVGFSTEWGPSRHQLEGELRVDRHGDTRIGLVAGNGYRLGSFGLALDTGGEVAKTHATGQDELGASLRGAYSTVEDPKPIGVDLGGFGGAGGKAVGGSVQMASFENTRVYIRHEGSAETSEAAARDLYRQVASGEASWADLPPGAALSTDEGKRSGVGLAGLYGAFSGAIGVGRGAGHVVEVGRPDDQTWTFSRNDQHSVDGSLAVGVMGVGPGVRGQRDTATGDGFTLRGELTPEIKAEVQGFVDVGVLPGARRLDPEAAERLDRGLRLLDRAESLGPQAGEARTMAERQIRSAVSDLNDEFRAKFAPGDEIPGLPGLEYSRSRTTEGGSSATLFVLPVHERSRHATEERGIETKSDGVHRTERGFGKDGIAWSAEATQTPEGTLFRFGVQSKGAFTDPSVLAAVPNDAPPGLLEAARDGADVKLPGALEIAIDDQQLAALAEDADKGAEWPSLGAETAAMLEGTFGVDPEAARRIRAAQNQLGRGDLAAYHATEAGIDRGEPELLRAAHIGGEAKAAADRLGVDPKAAVARFAEVKAPADFENLSAPEQALFSELQGLRGASTEAVMPRLLATAGRIGDPALQAETLTRAFSRDDRGDLFGRANPEDVNRAGEGDLATGLVRYLAGRPIGEPLLEQASFRFESEGLSRLSSLGARELERAIEDSYGMKSNGRGSPKLRVNARQLTEALLTTARREPSLEAASDAVWSAIERNGIEPTVVLRRFPKTPEGDAYRRMFADMLIATGAPERARPDELEALLAAR